MRKPLVMMPFIFVYKIVFGIFGIIINLCKYFYLGISYILNNIGRGFVVICFCLYQIPKYFIKGVIFILKPKKTKKKISKDKKVTSNKTMVQTVSFNMKEFQRLRNLKQKEVKRIRQEEIKRKSNIELEKSKKIKGIYKRKDNDSYVNDKVKKPKSTFKLSDFFSNIGKKIGNIFGNNDIARRNKNEEMLKKEALLINFDGADAEKSDTKILYQYVAKNPEGKIVTDYFEAYSKVEVHSFLLSEGYEVYSIKTNKWIQLFHKNSNTNTTKFKNKDLIFFLTQLSTYIKAGIPLVEALRILEKQYKNKKYKRILNSIIYDLTMGESLSNALLKQGNAFPKLLINMVKTAEMTGELAEVLDDQAKYYDQVEKIRKEMVSAMMYPCIVLVASIGVAIFIMLYVIPQFVEIYETMDASKIPKFTLIVLAVSNFLKKYIWFILAGVVIVTIILVYLYKTIRSFRTVCQYIAMKIPVIGNAIIYNEVAMFTKTFSSLLAHNVFITDSMEVLNKITNNEIYKTIIIDTISNLAKGDKISEAFKDNWAFPIPAYEMLVTGERTGELPEMMSKVAEYYQELHADSVKRIKTVAEPAITIFLTVIVGTLIMAIIIPMFSMYTTVQEM